TASGPIRAFRALPIGLLAWMIPPALVAVYLAAHQALRPFLDMATHYLPLYGSISRAHETIPEGERLRSAWLGLRALGGHGLWLVPAAFGAWTGATVVERSRPTRAFAWTLAAVTLGFALYPAASGPLRPYHF